jgi:hypothetical protein
LEIENTTSFLLKKKNFEEGKPFLENRLKNRLKWEISHVATLGLKRITLGTNRISRGIKKEQQSSRLDRKKSKNRR